MTIDVTIERIEQILGLPRGTEEGKSVTLPTSAPNQVIDLFLQHGKSKKAIPSAKKPTLKNMAIGAADLLDLMEVVDTKMKVRCFLMIVLNKFLIPSSGSHLNDRQAQIAWDLDSVVKIDWCKLVFEDLKDCIKNRHDDNNNCSGCSIVLLIAVFEALVPSKCPTTEPSVIGYDDEKLKLLLEQIRDKVGVKKERGIDVSNKAQPTEQNRSFLEFEEEIHAIMKEMADHLDDVKCMVPDGKRESIQCSLGTFNTLTKSNGSHTIVRIERIAGTKHKYKITGRGAYGAYGRKSKGCYKDIYARKCNKSALDISCDGLSKK
ncbi:hypothetical protein SORBI_3007G179332 [Sorghum bicolor]|uniref:Uncharacterized protein n=1 Tax=Sorghum bicolor TaxID=4558 RepID=A0A1Z5RB03_SORBI|nr:hypothetical protein SORBI_3007G179332 [Sorghum bicolor]